VTLTARVSAFFLGWLGLALIGFSAGVYLVVQSLADRQVEDRLHGTLETLVAGAEIHRDGIEWEAHERNLPRGESAAIWLVVLPDGRVIDRSGPAAGHWLRADGDTLDDPGGDTWRAARRRLLPGEPQVRPPTDRAMVEELGIVKYDYLDLVVAVPYTPIRRDLGQLAWTLAGLSVGLWLTAALVGRSLTRRTLAPVTEMATAASELSPADAGERLAVRPTGDELEHLGRAFNGALDRLEEAFERQRRFTGDASHQLRTPLATVLGQVEVALRRDREPGEYRDTLRHVAAEVQHLRRMTEALLFLARADPEANLPDLVVLDLTAWACEHVARWRTENAGTRIEIAADGLRSPVRAHPELLAQLIDNLLDNAVKYGREPIRVRVSRHAGDTEVALEDAGPGIPSEDLPHLFDPFFRSAAARTAGIRGVGLGLSVARRIAEAMGATLTAESEPGRGSRFTLRFPPAGQSSSSSSTS
jgi:heavy metal sensor kinase